MPGNVDARKVFQRLAWKKATTTDTKPASRPTDRSMPPVTMTSTMPAAMMDVTDICRNRLEMFCGDR